MHFAPSATRARERLISRSGGLQTVFAILLHALTSSLTAQPVLPPPDLPAPPAFQPPLKVHVNQFRYHGNTVFSDHELDLVLGAYLFRDLTTAQLEQARRALTLHYVKHGYVNSGAIIPDQSVPNGIITFQIIEGRLSDVLLTGQKRLRPRPIQKRIQLGAGSPLKLQKLQETLLLLKQDPNIDQINAQLQPGPSPGTSRLAVELAESNPWHWSVEARNDRPPSVGAETVETLAAHSNLTGHGDLLQLRYGIAHGGLRQIAASQLNDWGLSYAIPFGPRHTSLHAYYDTSDYDVLQEPFAELDVSSRSRRYGLTLQHPLHETLHRKIVFSLAADHRQNKTYLLGEPFSFSPGAIDGKSSVTALRFSQEWIERSQTRVLAFRSTFSLGVDWLDSTDDGTDRDGTFLSWLGQAQYIRRLGRSPAQVVLSTTCQWANQPLLSIEQFSLGGAHTVRGYRENQLVRDTALVTSLELHLPVITSRNGTTLLTLVPFLDHGVGWNVQSPTPQPSDLTSAGFGIVATPHRAISGRLFWGYPFRDWDNPNEDLQDQGVHFRLTVSLR